MDVLMPQLGETVAEGKIIKWFKSVGDSVAPGENLCEIETDKVTVEVPAISSGVLSAINAEVGTVAPVGAVIAVLSDGKATSPPATASASLRPEVATATLPPPRRHSRPCRHGLSRGESSSILSVRFRRRSGTSARRRSPPG